MKSNTIGSFNGFNPEIVSFFSELKANNTREWFDEHRDFYEQHIKNASKAFVMEMQERFSKSGLPYYADPKKSLFRINRDTRFSANKDPYKTNLGIYFPYTIAESMKKPVNSLGIYFHIEPGMCFIAGGIHMPEPDILKALRAKVAEDYDLLLEIAASKGIKSEFETVFSGERLKRAPQGYPQDHPAVELLKLKEFTMFSNIDLKETFNKDIAEIMERKSAAAIPFMDFFHNAL